MENNNMIDIMIIFQVINIAMLFIERKYIIRNWNKIRKRALYGRILFAFLPAFIIISLTHNPL